MRLTLGTVLVVAVIAFPAASAQDPGAARDRPTSHVTFYGHVFATGLDAPMPSNDQPPEGEEVFGLGSTDTCTPAGTVDNYVGDVPSASPGVDCEKNPVNKLALFSSAGFVDVKGRDAFFANGDYTLFHNERGLTKAIHLDPNAEVTASIWMSLDAHSWFVGSTFGLGSNETECPYPNPRDTPCVYPYWGWDPGVWPDWTVRATLYAAVLGEHGANPSEAPPIREAIESGKARVIAEGRSTPRQVVNGLPGNPNVHRFDVNLGAPQSSTIDREESFFLVYSWLTDTGGTKYSIHNWRLWAGEFFPPTYTLPVRNAFDVELVLPNFVYEKLAIVGVMNTPWGSYDVDPAATTLVVTEKSSGREVTPLRIETFSDYSTAHGGHYRPVNQTWVWDYKRDSLAPGTYVATVSATNWAHSASATCSAEFTILAGSLPGPVVEGRCGDQTASEEFVEEVRNLEGGGRDPRGDEALPLAPVALLPALVLFRRRSA